MSGSNPFRRKQDQVLGLDNSSFINSVNDVSRAPTRFSQAETSSIGSQRRVRLNSPQSSQKSQRSQRSRESDDGHSDGESFLSISTGDDQEREHFQSVRRVHSSDSKDNPFDAEWDEDEFEDEDLYHAAARRRRGPAGISSKASRALGVNHDNHWRTSTASSDYAASQHRDSTVSESQMVPSKAQRMLGIAERGRTINENDFRRKHSLSKDGNAVAPKALKMLGMPSNPFQKTAPSEDKPMIGEKGDPYSIPPRQGGRMDVDEFKRMILGSGRDSPTQMEPGHYSSTDPRFPRRMDSTSSTDVSVASHSSYVSSQPDYRLETPRSSHEISPDDWNPKTVQYPYWAHPPYVSSRPSRPSTTATDSSYTDPMSLYTTGPLRNRLLFSTSASPPISPTDLNKPLPQVPYRSSHLIAELPDREPAELSAEPAEAIIYELAATTPKPKTVPEPPMARRHSQRRKGEALSELAGSPIYAELPTQPLERHPSAPLPNTTNIAPKHAPAPPPRRGGSNHISAPHPNIPELAGTSRPPPNAVELSAHPNTGSMSSSSSASTSLSNPPQQQQQTSRPSSAHSYTSSSTSSQKKPPPPPARNSSIKRPGHSSRSSTNSTSIIPSPLIKTTTISIPAAPPQLASTIITPSTPLDIPSAFPAFSPPTPSISTFPKPPTSGLSSGHQLASMPPPPPPPRRRGSSASRSSMDIDRDKRRVTTLPLPASPNKPPNSATPTNATFLFPGPTTPPPAAIPPPLFTKGYRSNSPGSPYRTEEPESFEVLKYATSAISPARIPLPPSTTTLRPDSEIFPSHNTSREMESETSTSSSEVASPSIPSGVAATQPPMSLADIATVASGGEDGDKEGFEGVGSAHGDKMNGLEIESGGSEAAAKVLEPPKRDVLADLGALQREVDELRGKFRDMGVETTSNVNGAGTKGGDGVIG